MASLISLNFVLNIIEAYYNNIDPASTLQLFFDKLDTSFSVIFTIELCVNMFSTLFAEFFSDGWNWSPTPADPPPSPPPPLRHTDTAPIPPSPAPT